MSILEDDINDEIKKPATSGYIELFEIDTTTLFTGGAIYRLTPMNPDTENTPIRFNDFDWLPFPMKLEGISFSKDEAPARPILEVSNINKIFQSLVTVHDDMIGVPITRYRTFAAFLDDGPTPNPNAILRPDKFIIAQKTNHNKVSISWMLQSVLDVENDLIPKRLIIRDRGFPGAGTVRVR